MIEVSANTRRRIEAVFSEPDWQRVAELLVATCGDNLPAVEATYDELAERIRFAVLKLSGGSLRELQTQIEQAATDWRDVLVQAEFADDTSIHLTWRPW